jgi:hypothetical protein
VKIYVTAVEAHREKERQDETQFSTKIDGFLSFSPPPPPPLMLLYFFAGFLFNLSLCTTNLRVSLVLVLCFHYFMDNSILLALMDIARGSNRGMGGIALKNLNLCSKKCFS